MTGRKGTCETMMTRSFNSWTQWRLPPHRLPLLRSSSGSTMPNCKSRNTGEHEEDSLDETILNQKLMTRPQLIFVIKPGGLGAASVIDLEQERIQDPTRHAPANLRATKAHICTHARERRGEERRGEARRYCFHLCCSWTLVLFLASNFVELV